MSEPEALRAVLIGHGAMAEGMVDAVRHITGCEPDAIRPLTNRGMSPDALAAQVLELLESDRGIIFTDLPSGSCGFVARRLQQTGPGLIVISGINLPLLVEFVMNRTVPVAELVPRLLAKGRAAMGCAPSHLGEHADRAVSGG